MTVAGVWMANFGITGYAVWVHIVTDDPTNAYKSWSILFTAVQYVTVIVSMGIYAVVLAVLVVKRLAYKGKHEYWVS